MNGMNRLFISLIVGLTFAVFYTLLVFNIIDRPEVKRQPPNYPRCFALPLDSII